MQISILSLLLLFSLNGLSQVESDSIETVYTPKTPFSKHTFSLDGIMNYTMLRNAMGKDDNLYKNNLDGGINISYIYSTSNRFGFGLEYSLDFSNLNVNTGDLHTMESLITNDYLRINHEGIDIIVQSLTPKIQWKTKRETENHGFYHQFGVGISFTSVLKKDYDYTLTLVDPASQQYILYDPNDAEETYDPNQLYNYKNKGYIGGSIMYGLTYRGIISKVLQWSVGIRTQLNLNISYFSNAIQTDQEDAEYWINSREMNKIVARNRTSSLFHLQFGIIYKLAEK